MLTKKNRRFFLGRAADTFMIVPCVALLYSYIITQQCEDRRVALRLLKKAMNFYSASLLKFRPLFRNG